MDKNIETDMDKNIETDMDKKHGQKTWRLTWSTLTTNGQLKTPAFLVFFSFTFTIDLEITIQKWHIFDYGIYPSRFVALCVLQFFFFFDHGYIGQKGNLLVYTDGFNMRIMLLPKKRFKNCRNLDQRFSFK